MRALAAAFAFALTFPALAQDELGLDLSDAEVAEEYRPALAVIGVSAVEGSEEREKGRAALLETELSRVASTSTKFGKVLQPQQVAEALGADAAKARTCTDFACLQALADKLGVHRVITGTVSKAGLSSLLTLSGFDPGQSSVVVSTVESGEKQEKQMIGGFTGLTGKTQAQKDRDFVKKATPAYSEMLGKISTALGKIVVDCFEPTAETTLNGRPIGKGAFQTLVAKGDYQLKTLAEGYLPFEAALKVESQQVASVRVTLVAKPIDPALAANRPVVDKPVGTPVAQRPGLYIAIAGVAAIVAGAIMAGTAMGAPAQADPDGDGIANIPRSQLKDAQGSATGGTVLMVVGAAAVAGGGLWFFLTPSRTTVDGPRGPDEGDGAPTTHLGVMFGAGGTF